MSRNGVTGPIASARGLMMRMLGGFLRRMALRSPCSMEAAGHSPLEGSRGRLPLNVAFLFLGRQESIRVRVSVRCRAVAPGVAEQAGHACFFQAEILDRRG